MSVTVGTKRQPARVRRRRPRDLAGPGPAVQVAELAERVFGSREKALRWLGKRKDRLGGLTPLEIVSTRGGAALVTEMLHQIDHGIAA